MTADKLLNEESNESISLESNDDDEEFKDTKLRKAAPKKRRRISKYKQGHWTTEEHDLYLSFLRINYERCMSEKQNTIFKQMAKYIGTRTPGQCRSHHQKFDPQQEENLKRKHRVKMEAAQNQEQTQSLQLSQAEELEECNLFVIQEPRLRFYSESDIIYQESFQNYLE